MKTKIYLTVRPTWSKWGRDSEGHPRLESMVVEKMTKSWPTKGAAPAGSVVVALTLDIPDQVFKPAKYAANVEFNVNQVAVVAAEPEEPRP